MIFTLVVFLALLMIACIGGAIIPSYDQRVPVTPQLGFAKEPRAIPSRSA